MRVAALLTALFLVAPAATPRLTLDAQDRAAFMAWFTLLADAQFYRATPDVTDCAALVRHATREALRDHTPEWLRRIAIPGGHVRPALHARPIAAGDSLPLFRVSDTTPARYAEFADARTILRLNAALVSRDVAAARPGDLLAFRQEGQRLPEHLMVFVGRSAFEPGRTDWVVYHTGPDAATGAPGEMRKASLADLRQHPSPRWRPLPGNPAFLGVYRLRIA
ncbi:hypothetical protein LuPra_03146 [Luteitalea pratensis]|uniref:DUF1175 domain-containing protein n=1 Tax=Luteitalea pratensis TaxID=1855912 RepID=A0A143PQ25_LUTPR|nr:DUF1175 family protein [Luteitalea pratensis]AMY09919.1 hypothetical protein LuPra_03146 [Luteitalea pratensis]